jgi:phosphoglycolate phosphatase-like HAD superfamily hydrolase
MTVADLPSRNDGSAKHAIRAFVSRVTRRGGAAMLLVGLVFTSGCRNTPGTVSAPATTPPPAASQTDPLPSWNDGPSKKAIVAFVTRVTTGGGPDFVAPAERIATFDNDGTLWSEQPIYFQAAFALDRVKELSPSHPEWTSKQPFKGIIEDDMKAVTAAGEKGLAELLAVTHTGNTTDEFDKIVRDWIANARHPKTNRPYTEMVFQPMLELLNYLRANGFKTYIVSGGGIDFMRPWTERVYGIPPEQVIGSRAKVRYEVRNGQPAILKLPEVDLVDDKAGKPVGIYQVIGRRPIAAFGNSDGDFEMLEWTTSGPGARFGLIVHHTDGEREWAYDRTSHIGQLARGLDEAPKRGWTVVDMKNEWKVIYPFQK